MDSIKYIHGDATQPHADGNKIIAHICNDIGGWGRGFVVAISKRWLEPERTYRDWYANRAENDFALGRAHLVKVTPDIWVANMIGQHKKTAINGVPPIRYEAVSQALEQVVIEAQSRTASVHMPRIGCGLAGGTWDKIEPIITQTLCTRGIEVTIYDWSG